MNAKMPRMKLPVVLPDDIATETRALYKAGLPPGSQPGWENLRPLFTVADSQLTVVTGIPGSGKSEFMDALAVNLSETDDWGWAIYSPENYPVAIHMAKLTEKRTRSPFGPGPTERMTPPQLDTAMDWVNDHFEWLDPTYPTYGALLEAALYFRNTERRHFGIILDPWNSLEHLRPDRQSETDYVCEALTNMLNLARKHGVHIFVVAHPTKIAKNQQTGVRPIPTPYDISGGAHWYNRPDNIITVHRDQDDRNSNDVQVHVQKIKFKHIGRLGVADLKYERVTGRYHDAPRARDQDEDLPF